MIIYTVLDTDTLTVSVFTCAEDAQEFADLLGDYARIQRHIIEGGNNE